MIKVSSLKRGEQRRLIPSRRARIHIFSTILIVGIFLTYCYICTTHTKLTTSYPVRKPIHIVVKRITQEAVLEDTPNPLVPPINQTRKQQIKELKQNLLPELDILKSTTLSRRFEKRAQEFFKDGCKVRFFMTYLSSSMKVFGDREFLAVDSLFKSNPNGCLMILSNTMDSVYGLQILKPLTDCGFRVQAITPDLDFLFKNTPARSWLAHIKNGKTDPGKIPLAQNLSNLIRLAILYKYGGVYMDTDFVILKDVSSLHNSIGAQSSTRSGNWTRLNNAVLIFDKNHHLLYKFIQEFTFTFNGNKWGYNGPYLVSRVVEREATTLLELNFTVLHPKAFYPVDWTRIRGFFTPPVNTAHRKWIKAKVGQLSTSTYGVHLWNKQSNGLRIEEGSIMARLIRDHCVICNVQ